MACTGQKGGWEEGMVKVKGLPLECGDFAPRAGVVQKGNAFLQLVLWQAKLIFTVSISMP